jgi:SAM-dependent methyltransferase
VKDRERAGGAAADQDEQWQAQRANFNAAFSHGSRAHVTSTDPLTRYLVRWRLQTALRRLQGAAPDISTSSSILVMCAGEGLEGTVLCDLGYTDVTVSDISDVGVGEALRRDPRLKGLPLNAERADLPAESYDVVLVQDGLHHLASPVAGFTEMLRICRRAAVFLEPHDSFVGRRLGREWEVNGPAVNYVFRWSRRLVEQISSGYLGQGRSVNLSFAFWHHNVVLERLGRKVRPARAAKPTIAATKTVLDAVAGRAGNQFCGLVVKRQLLVP